MIFLETRGLCHLCGNLTTGEYFRSGGGNQVLAPANCEICDRFVCDQCCQRIFDGDNEDGRLYRVCSDCVQADPHNIELSHLREATCDVCRPKIALGFVKETYRVCPDCRFDESLFNRQAREPIRAIRYFCSFCKKNFSLTERRSWAICAGCQIPLCRPCQHQGPSGQPTCHRCLSYFQKDASLCPACGKGVVDLREPKSFFDCIVCAGKFCMACRTPVEYRHRIRNSCPTCLPHCKPLQIPRK